MARLARAAAVFVTNDKSASDGCGLCVKNGKFFAVAVFESEMGTSFRAVAVFVSKMACLFGAVAVVVTNGKTVSGKSGIRNDVSSRWKAATSAWTVAKCLRNGKVRVDL